MKHARKIINMFAAITVAILFLLPFVTQGEEPTWIQYSEPLAGENSPTFTDVLNRPAKTIWQNFLIEHGIAGYHNYSAIKAGMDLTDKTDVTTFEIEHNPDGTHTTPIPASTTDLTEGTNLYYTDARVSANSDVSDNTTHRNTTTGNPHSVTAAEVGAVSTSQHTSDLATKTDVTTFEIEHNPDGTHTTPIPASTTDLTEGTNLYYTESRVSANTDVTANTSHRNTTTGNPHSVTAADVDAPSNTVFEVEHNPDGTHKVLPSSGIDVTDDTTSVTVDTLRFNPLSGFEVIDDGAGQATISLGSTWNPWQVDGQDTLDATGEETIEFRAGPGIALITDILSTPKALEITTTFDADEDDIPDNAEQLSDGVHTATASEVRTLLDTALVEEDWTGYSNKAAPVDADKILLSDSEDSNALKTVLWSQIGGGGTVGETLELPHQTSTPSTVSGSGVLYAIPEQGDIYTKLQIHSDDSDGSTAIIDSSQSAHSLVPTGVIHSTDTSKIGASSLKFNGSSYVTIAQSNDWIFGSQDFTFETWFYTSVPTSTTKQGLIQFSGSSEFAIFFDNGQLQVHFDGDTSSYNSFTLTTQDALTWIHVAVCRSGDTLYVFRDGILQDTFPLSGKSIDEGGTANYLGLYGVSYLTGYLDEIRFSVGTARWTSNFSPPLTPYSDTDPQALVFLADDGAITNITNHTHAEFSDPDRVSVTAVAGDYTAGIQDQILAVDTSAARTITIPSALIQESGYFLTVKDISGNAAAQNISIATEGSETIDGQASASIASNYGVMRLFSDGNNLYTY